MSNRQHRLHDKFIKEAEFDLERGLEHCNDPRREYESVLLELFKSDAEAMHSVSQPYLAEPDNNNTFHDAVSCVGD